MRKLGMLLLASATLLGASAGYAAQGDNARIIDEGMNRSQVMVNASQLMDGIGGRLTNSHSLDRAEDWAIAKLRSYGLSNVHREPFSFGRGWNYSQAYARMVSPRPIDMITIPVAWTPGTNGAIRAPIVVAPIDNPQHFAAYRGKLAGKIVLVTLPGTSDEPKEGAFKRLTDKDIGEDDAKRLQKDVDDAMAKVRTAIETDAKAKEADIMKV